MAREPSITEEQVSRMADVIVAEDGRPTARAIRHRLGTGSMATVLKFLQAWQDAQARPPASPVTLPASLHRELTDFVAQEIERGIAEREAELDIARQAKTDLIAESERQAETIVRLTAELEVALADRATLTGRLAQVEADLNDARGSAAAERQAAEVARTDLAKALLRLEAVPRLEVALDAALRESVSERTACVEAERKSAVAGARLDAAVDARQKAETEVLELRQREAAGREEMRLLRVDLKEAGAVAASLRNQVEAIKQAPQATKPSKDRRRES